MHPRILQPNPYNRYHVIPCKLFNTVEGYRRKSVCFQLEASARIQVRPMTVVSLIQMRVNDVLGLFDAAMLAACIGGKRRISILLKG